jgi:hypothetical protein
MPHGSRSPTLSVTLVALLAAACNSSAPDGPSPASPSAPAASTDAQSAPAAAAPGAARPSREQLISEALARVKGIQDSLGTLRQLPFKTDVPAEHQTQEKFREFVKAEIARELPAEKSASVSRALHHIGLITEKLDLGSTLEDALVSQAGAYYDPKAKKFFVVMVPNSPQILDTIAAHELTHALQDQHFDLDRYVGAKPESQRPSEDQLQARRFVVEGEATLMMMVYLAHGMTKMNLLDPKLQPNLEMQLGMMAKLDASQLAEMTQKQAGSFVDLGDDFKAAMEAMDDIPPYVLVPLLEAYTKGAVPVFAAYRAGGWDAVAALYSNPPDSTEQVLHPADKLIGKRDYPVAIQLADEKGWSELHADVMGEILWRVYFMNWKAGDPSAAAAGWDGDRYAVLAKGDATVGLLGTIWDSAAEAEEFEKAYLESLAKRFPGAAPKTEKGHTAVARPDGTLVLVKRRGDRVSIVDGAAAADAAGLLARVDKAKLRKHPKDK